MDVKRQGSWCLLPQDCILPPVAPAAQQSSSQLVRARKQARAAAAPAARGARSKAGEWPMKGPRAHLGVEHKDLATILEGWQRGRLALAGVTLAGHQSHRAARQRARLDHKLCAAALRGAGGSGPAASRGGGARKGRGRRQVGGCVRTAPYTYIGATGGRQRPQPLVTPAIRICSVAVSCACMDSLVLKEGLD